VHLIDGQTEKVIHGRDDMGLLWINEVLVSFGEPRLLDGATLQRGNDQDSGEIQWRAEVTGEIRQ
jgi:hypothetical protein